MELLFSKENLIEKYKNYKKKIYKAKKFNKNKQF